MVGFLSGGRFYRAESGLTTTTGTGTSSSTSSSSGSDSDSSDSSSSDSDSGSSSDDETEKPDESTPMSESELEPIYRSCIRNLEECVTRFSEHYKSIYRLVNHYLRSHEKLRDIEMCQNLLLGSYKTKLGNQIMGLFSDRKNNNFFNGIWRIPSSEIDRPGSFSAHLVKCVVILLEVLKKSKDYKVLIDMAVQLNRPPDNDKRYIKEVERKDLCEQSLSFCVQVMRESLKQLMEKRNDEELLALMIDIFKTQKVCNKHISQKETLFEQILIDAYKFYIQDKVAKMPDNANLSDLAVKLCNQEISVRKNQEKQALAAAAAANLPGSSASNLMDTTVTAVSMPATTAPPATTVPASKPVTIPGITSRPRGRPVGSKTVNKNMPPPSVVPPSMFDPTALTAMMYANPGLSTALLKDPNYMKTFAQEYYKICLGNTAMSSLLSSKMPSSNMSSAFSTSAALSQPSTSATKPSIPQFDMNKFMATLVGQPSKSAPSVPSSSSSTINLGGGELTITPTTSKSNITGGSKELKLPTSMSLSSQIFSSMAGTSISMTRVPTPMPITSSRSEPSASASQLSLLPDLPKSLTITPAPSFSSEKLSKPKSNSPQLSMFPERAKESGKYTSKGKASKKSIPTPYSRSPSAPLSSTPPFSTSSAAQLSNLSALAQQMPFLNNFNLQNYNSQVNLLKTYADFLSLGMSSGAGLGATGMGQVPPFQMPGPPKKSTTKKPRAPRSQPRFTSPSTTSSIVSSGSTPRLPDSITAIPIPPTKTKQSSQQFSSGSFNVPLAKSPILARSSPNPSPGLSPVGGVLGVAHQSVPSVTPPNLPSPSGGSVSLIQSSPTKTLQQKLAERQKANALNESSVAHRPGSAGASGSGGTSGGGIGGGGGGSQHGTKKKDVDIIILD